MKSYEQIARAMYIAWVDIFTSGDLTREYVSWESLSELYKQSWIAAAKQAHKEFEIL